MSDFDLQCLVHALDKAEKSHFKKICGDVSQYVELFDDLNDAPPMGEEEFKKVQQGKAYMDRFSYNKGYLREAIHAAMRSQRKRKGQEKAIQLQVVEWLEDAAYLHKKLLPTHCWKRLGKAEKSARSSELHEELLRTLRFKGRLVVAEQEKGYADQARAIYAECLQLTEIIQNKFAYLNLKNQLFLFNRTTPEVRTSEQQAEIQALRHHPLLSDIAQANSLDAKLNFHFCHALLHQFDKDLQGAFRHHREMFFVWKAKPHFQKARPNGFRNALNNFLLLCCAVNEYDDFVEAVTLMEKEPFSSTGEKWEVKSNGHYVRLQYFITLGKWKDAAAIEQDCEDKWEHMRPKMIPSREMAFYMSFVRLNMVLDRWKVADVWAQKVLDMRSKEVREDIRRHALIFSMVINFELGKIDELENRYRAIDREFKKKQQQLQFEQEVVKLLRAWPGIADQKDAEQSMRDFLARLDELQTLPGERNALGFDFLLYWLEAKVKGQTLMQALEKHRESPSPGNSPV